MGLTGRVALVSGGGRGIGRAIAMGLASDGASVAVNYRKDEVSALETVRMIESLELAPAKAYQASIDDFDADKEMVDQIIDDFGFVDILINNAGIASRGNSTADTDPAEMERVWRTHAFGAFALSKLVLPSMRTCTRGDIIMISSTATRGWGANSSPYNVAKASMEALAWGLAKEEKKNGIHVHIVSPGLVDTDMGRRLVKGAMGVDDIHALDDRSPFGRVCQPEDVSDVVRYLVSDSAAYLQAQKIEVDGGG
ncbi:MAG: oxidoreductase [Actinomycetia bacterium]|nr:oxidoreductase [Actinomycetes bacterium]